MKSQRRVRAHAARSRGRMALLRGRRRRSAQAAPTFHCEATRAARDRRSARTPIEPVTQGRARRLRTGEAIAVADAALAAERVGADRAHRLRRAPRRRRRDGGRRDLQVLPSPEILERRRPAGRRRDQRAAAGADRRSPASPLTADPGPAGDHRRHARPHADAAEPDPRRDPGPAVGRRCWRPRAAVTCTAGRRR